MKERPILFSAPMVRAILEGRKTVTRRAVKFNDAGRVARGGKQWHIDDPNVIEACPYGQPGDRLWVRETWCIAWDDENDCWPDPERYHYRADGYEVVHVDGGERSPWKPSIHMPRWASRITLEVTGVRVERLHDISYEDALAEGVIDGAAACEAAEPGKLSDDGETSEEVARRLRWPQRYFQEIWESINGPGSWDANPFVWVIEFKRVKP